MDQSSSGAAGGFFILFFVLYAVFILALLIFGIWLQWRILAKAGFSGWLSLLILTGIGGIIIQLILAFGEWPIHRQLAMGGAGGNPYGAPAYAGAYGATAPPPPTPPIGGPPMTT